MELLSLAIISPLLGGLLIFLIKDRRFSKFISYLSSLISLIAFFVLFLNFEKTGGFQHVISLEWIPAWRVNIEFGLDKFNAPFAILTSLISIVAIHLSLRTAIERVENYLSLILLLQFTVIGFYLSTNLFLFFIFYEAMLPPAFFLIYRWGTGDSYRAAFKFLIYTFAFSIFLFIGIIGVFMAAGSFSFESLKELNLSLQDKTLLYLAFFLAFAVKIPIVPLHGWLRDAYYLSPTPITIFMSAVMGKMGIYGLLRVTPYFSDVLLEIGWAIILLCLISFIYAAFLALNQRDMKLLFSYMSLSHVGIITAGLLSGTLQGLNGSLLQSINHGVLAASFFYLAEIFKRQTKSYDMDRLGALSKRVPVLVFFTFAFVMAMGGFPGLSYFNGEILLLSGIFRHSVILGFLAIIGVAIGVVYLCYFFYRVFLKKPGSDMSLLVRDVRGFEFVIFSVFFIITLYLGLNPSFVIGQVENIFTYYGR